MKADVSDLSPGSPWLEAEELRERGLAACVGPRPVVLDIGFGRAESRRIERAGLAGVRLVHTTAELLLERILPDAAIAEIWINFPDPWPKKRHFRRRLIRREVVAQLARVLEPGGRLFMATDYEPYARWIADVMAGSPGFENVHAPEAWSGARPGRRETAYEAEFLAEGRSIAYFEYRRERAGRCAA
jgi:tRNA (guanine-N7-)-methyltransferase